MFSIQHIYTYKHRVLGESGAYPSTDNCHVVEFDSGDGKTWTDHYMPKPALRFLEAMIAIRDKVSKAEMETILKTFDEYGSWKYSEGSDDESMSHAGEDL